MGLFKKFSAKAKQAPAVDNNIYSHVFEHHAVESRRAQVQYFFGDTGTISYNLYTDVTNYLVATPIQGDEEKYRLYSHVNAVTSDNAGLGPPLRNNQVKPLPGVFTQELVIKVLQSWDKDFATRQEFAMSQNQPFGDRLVDKVAAKLTEAAAAKTATPQVTLKLSAANPAL